MIKRILLSVLLVCAPIICFSEVINEMVVPTDEMIAVQSNQVVDQQSSQQPVTKGSKFVLPKPDLSGFIMPGTSSEQNNNQTDSGYQYDNQFNNYDSGPQLGFDGSNPTGNSNNIIDRPLFGGARY